MDDLIEGNATEEITPAAWEVVFAGAYGWTLEYIREMSIKDFREHAPLAIAVFRRKMQKMRI